MMTKRNTLIAGASALVLAAGGVGVAQAIGGDDGEGTATGPAADAARAAALELVPGGTANAVERDGEKGATWEVEIAKPDGSVVDVRLDKAFKLVVIDGDTGDGADERADDAADGPGGEG